MSPLRLMSLTPPSLLLEQGGKYKPSMAGFIVSSCPRHSNLVNLILFIENHNSGLRHSDLNTSIPTNNYRTTCLQCMITFNTPQAATLSYSANFVVFHCATLVNGFDSQFSRHTFVRFCQLQLIWATAKIWCYTASVFINNKLWI